jgi:hypothetical protein
MKQAVEVLEAKLGVAKAKIAEVESSESMDYTVLASYETEMELILSQALAYRTRIISSSVKFATLKIREAQDCIVQGSESSTLQRRSKFVMICRMLFKKVSSELSSGEGHEQAILLELADLLGECLSYAHAQRSALWQVNVECCKD